MSRKIFVNLPVKDLQHSVKFFTALGFTFNPQFTDDTATCMIVSDDIFVMLLTDAKFATFTDRAIVDAHKQVECLIALSQDSDDDVNRMADAAVKAGGREPRPAQDLGFMYQRVFQDPDGHAWELVHMRAMPQ